MTACDYCLSNCSDDGHSLDDEGCGSSRECFHVDLGGLDEGNHLGMPEDSDPPRPAQMPYIHQMLIPYRLLLKRNLLRFATYQTLHKDLDMDD